MTRNLRKLAAIAGLVFVVIILIIVLYWDTVQPLQSESRDRMLQRISNDMLHLTMARCIETGASSDTDLSEVCAFVRSNSAEAGLPDHVRYDINPSMDVWDSVIRTWPAEQASLCKTYLFVFTFPSNEGEPERWGYTGCFAIEEVISDAERVWKAE